MHTLGFNHEMARHDRDNYIVVVYPNIEVILLSLVYKLMFLKCRRGGKTNSKWEILEFMITLILTGSMFCPQIFFLKNHEFSQCHVVWCLWVQKEEVRWHGCCPDKNFLSKLSEECVWFSSGIRLYKNHLIWSCCAEVSVWGSYFWINNRSENRSEPLWWVEDQEILFWTWD